MNIIRIKFYKKKNVKFISHLDMMKAFQRAVRRAGLEAEYSQGFNPQMQMVFGAPLSLGFTSEGEYADFSFSQDYDAIYIKDKLNAVLPEELSIMDSGIRKIKKNIMADIMYAEYTFLMDTCLDLNAVVERTMKLETLMVEKTRKGKTKTVDIRPMIHNMESFGRDIKVLVRAGNQGNLNPRLLAKALKNHISEDITCSNYHRIEQYVERNGKMVLPLNKDALENI